MKTSVLHVVAALAAGISAVGAVAAPQIVSFKDAAKIKSWDAWDDHKAQAVVTNLLQREKPCVTWKRLNELDFGLKEIGRLATRTSSEVRSSGWSVGCETMDRDYAVWDNYKALLPMLGVKHARFLSGWAKTEQEKGVYDFAWLDRQLRECAAMRIRPWVCISYGNPVWGSDFRLGMRVTQVTRNPEALAAWIRYVRALVARYRDIVDEWEVWNEPFGQAEDYATLFYETARAVKSVQPEARVYCTALAMNRDMAKSDYAPVLEKLKRENALGLASRFAYHPYVENPDDSYEAGDGQFGWQPALPLRRFVKSYSDAFDIVQGECGCPSQLEYAHALPNIEWSEYSQAKWELRRAIGDAAHGIPSSCFTMIDLQYTFMLQSFGMVRSNALKEFVYRRPKWYAMRNVYALFDDDTKPLEIRPGMTAEITRRADPRETAGRKLTCAAFERGGRRFDLFWYSDRRPSSLLEFDRVTLRLPYRCEKPVWVDMITGRIGEIPAESVRAEGAETVLADVPLWDSPVLIADRSAVCAEAADVGNGTAADETAAVRAAEVSVDFGEKYGKVNPMIHCASWCSRFANSNCAKDGEELRKLNLQAYRTHDAPLVHEGQRIIDTHFIFPLMHLDPKDPRNYCFEPTDKFLKMVREQDRMKVLYRLGTSIEHTPDAFATNTRNPSDHAKYAEVLAGIVRHYTKGWADGFTWDIRYWELFNEPDVGPCWRGSRDEFAHLFVTCLKRLKSEFPELRIGGPGLGWSFGTLQKVLAACKQEGVKPDFISWHWYGVDADKLVAYPAKMRAFADEAGFKDAELILNEWHYLVENDWAALRSTGDTYVRTHTGPAGQNGIDSAAFTLYVSAKFQDTCLDQSYFYGCGYDWDWGWVDRRTREKVKPYYALQAMGELIAECTDRVRAASAAKGVAPFAATGADGRKAVVLIADYRSGVDRFDVTLKRLDGLALESVRILDQERNLAPVEAAVKDGRLTLQKRNRESSCFILRFAR